MPAHTATVHRDPSDGRARLPILIAALLLVASMAFIGSGIAGTAHAQAERGAIPSLNLASSEPGQLVITWETPEPAPTDYRLSWAQASLGFLSYKDANETQRANVYPAGDDTTLTLNNLSPGQDYKVLLRARYYDGEHSASRWSGPWTPTAATRVMDGPPAAPTGLTVSQVAHDSLTLAWDDPQDARITGHRVLRGTDADSLSTIEADTGNAGTEYTDATVAAETIYHYAVIALSNDGDGAQSSAISATTPAAPPPAAPTGLAVARVGHSVLTLTWDHPQDERITGYGILRGSSADSLSTITADTGSASTEYADDTVAAETTYFYAVLALSPDGDGPQSNAITATTTAGPDPKKQPQRVVARQSTVTRVPVDWSLKPTGLAVGDQFRLLFLSSTKRNASSSAIADYNTFIQTRAAAGHTDIRSYSTGFRAVGCTSTVDARDNTSTTYTATDKGVAIYWLNGAKAADEYEDFYDGSWDDEANDKNESGANGPDTSLPANYPFTGCKLDGTEAATGSSSRALGTASSIRPIWHCQLVREPRQDATLGIDEGLWDVRWSWCTRSTESGWQHRKRDGSGR